MLPVMCQKKFSTGRRNFPTAHRKFPTANRKFTTSSTKNHTANMGRKGKADIKALIARAEAIEQRAETLKVSLGAARMDVRDLIKSWNFSGTEGAVGLTRWFEKLKSVGIDAANATTWSEFKHMLIKKYCPRSELQS
nr:hypothetical protein [Tanacetum cinerariifolium]